jgi:hypothetical protein
VSQSLEAFFCLLMRKRGSRETPAVAPNGVARSDFKAAGMRPWGDAKSSGMAEPPSAIVGAGPDRRAFDFRSVAEDQQRAGRARACRSRLLSPCFISPKNKTGASPGFVFEYFCDQFLMVIGR